MQIKNVINNCQNYISKNGYPYLSLMSLFIELKYILETKKFDMFNINDWIIYNE